MRRAARIAAAATIAALSCGGAAFSAPPTEKPEAAAAPADIGFQERAEIRLAQIDVTVSGDAQVVESLTAGDFLVSVLGHRIDGLTLDRLCRSPREADPRPAEAARAATFLFFFDQPHLTMAGRQRAIETARDLVRRLVPGSGRAMIVSSAETIETFSGPTEDPGNLLAALDRLEKSQHQWDPYAQMEERRVADVLALLDDPHGGVHAAVARAREYQAEEAWQAERSLSRVSMALGLLDPVEPPKAVLYFADTMRARPGGHYVDLFGETVLRVGASALLDAEATLGSIAFDRLVNDAAAHGVRFYGIEAQGLSGLGEGAGLATSRGAAGSDTLLSAIPSNLRVRAAQDALSVLSLESGGQAFLNGMPAQRIARRILDDLSCLFVVSFDPLGLPEDEPLPVKVAVRKPGVETRSRGRLVVQSDSARLTSRLFAAFATPGASVGTLPLRATVVPTGYEDGRFGGLVQIFVPASPYPNAGWDIGASLLTPGSLHDETSARIEVGRGGVPVVLEREVRFSPGPFEIVAVARETSTDEIVSRHVEGAWPDPRSAAPWIGPIALLQPAAGAFHRAGATLPRGSLALPEEEPLLRDRAAALVTMVCGGARSRGGLRVARTLTGASTVEFPEIDLDPDDPCVQIRDLVPAGMLGPGEFRYDLRVLDGGEEIAGGSRRISVAAPPAP